MNKELPKVLVGLIIALIIAFWLVIYPSITENTRYNNACVALGGTPAHAEGFRACFAPGVLLGVPKN
jgi:hypothetical protein